jgi:hypothetical protein
MRLPNGNQAYVPELKLTGYLLSLLHPVGKSKARFLRRFGFNDANVGALRGELVALAQRADVEKTKPTAHGTKYVLTGSLSTPVGRTVEVTTVWIIEAGAETPRFVTAYPA